MPRSEEQATNLAIQCKGREAQIMNYTWPRNSHEKRIPSSVRGKPYQVNNEEKKEDSTRCFLRISNTGHAYGRPDVTSLGFTNDECQILASRQRATNYLLYMYSERGQPVLRVDGKKVSRSLDSDSGFSWRIKREQSENKSITLIRRNNANPRMLNRRLCCSALPRRKEKSERLAPPRRASLTALQTEASIDDSLGTIIIRSFNQDLSPSARLERYLINLQREGYSTSARKERKKNIDVELDRGITPKGVVSLRSKFLPHPPVYLFERAVKDSPFNESIKKISVEKVQRESTSLD